jgi:hypothetical protein
VRLVRAIAAALLLAATSAAAAPPPPPPPLDSGVPAQVGGYSTSAMNAVYSYWLRRQVAEAGAKALDRAVVKSYSESEGQSVFSLRNGPRVSAQTVWQDTADHVAFQYVCPRAADAPTLSSGQFLDYLKRIESQCGWQMMHARARFHFAEKSLGEEKLRPDFQRLSKLLREAGIAAPNDGSIPDQIFRELGDPGPILKAAVQIHTVTAKQCPGVERFLATLEGKQVTVDMEKVGGDRRLVTPHHHPSMFRVEIPLAHGGNGSGKIDLQDYGSGVAYEAWQSFDEALRSCSAAAARSRG